MAAAGISPRDLRTNRPTPARMYDYYLGGKDNFAVDREAAEQVLTAAPGMRAAAAANRAFLARAVRHLAAEAGVRQFIDVGTGLPRKDDAHVVARTVDRDVRVVYVDDDPIVHSHMTALLDGDPNVAVVAADLRRPEEILRDPSVRGLLRRDEPVAVLFGAVLHHLADGDGPYESVAAFRDAAAPGSYLAVTHITPREDEPRVARRIAEVYRQRRVTSPVVPRTRAEIMAFFDGYELAEPGLVDLPRWRPDTAAEPAAEAGGEGAAEPTGMLAGVGRRR